MKNLDAVIFLDIDGVLVNTFPVWKSDELDGDGYSKFNEANLKNLIELLEYNPSIRLIISSSRRFGKSIEDLETIFSYRGIVGKIAGKTPDSMDNPKSRGHEIKDFVVSNQVKNLLVLDDDLSVLDFEEIKDFVVKTEYRTGFDSSKLKEAKRIVQAWAIAG